MRTLAVLSWALGGLQLACYWFQTPGMVPFSWRAFLILLGVWLATAAICLVTVAVDRAHRRRVDEMARLVRKIDCEAAAANFRKQKERQRDA